MSQSVVKRNRGSTTNFYSALRTPSTSGSSTSRISSGSGCSASVESTPLSSRETMQKLIAGLSACQKSMEEVIKEVQSSNDRIEELADKVKALDDKVEKIMTSDHNGDSENSGDNGKKRKRTKSSLVLQEEVHKFHNSRDVGNQYKGRELVNSPHNMRVTQLIVNELCHHGEFAKTTVQRTAKKYHEHIRRTALGKITEDVKIRNKKNLRKE
ncbi:uncharacterized protein [Acropora muricata]|uniref:uncharacterized protein n=1 Tax=Acropora muricata TaxID=159855 RepID=UPI0034E50E2B